MKANHLPRSLRSRLLAVAILAALTGCAEDEGLSVALETDLQTILDDAVAQHVTPGAAIYVSDDGHTWSGSSGVSDMQRQTALDPGDHFRGGSLLKTFVATAIMQAVESDDLDLDDRLTDLLPASITDRIAGADRIDVDMLLTHRSGIAEWVDDAVHEQVAMDPAHVWTLDEILGLVEAQAPVFDPDAAFSYSNTNYVLLGEILEAVDGRSWRAVVREDVLARAHLDDTFLPEPGDLECPAPCAHGYVPVGDGMIDATRVDPSMAGASGGHSLITTAADLGAFLEALREGDLFDDPRSLLAMTRLRPALYPELKVVGYGYGLVHLDADGIETIGHIGGAAGYSSFMMYVPETDRYVSGYINVAGDIGAILLPVIARVGQP